MLSIHKGTHEGTHKGCPYGEWGRLMHLRMATLGTHKGCPYGGTPRQEESSTSPSKCHPSRPDLLPASDMD